MWSSGRSPWLQIQRSRVRFQALPDFLRSSGSGTGPTQPREYNRGARGSGSRKPRLTAVGIRCTDYETPSIRQSSTNFTDERRSVGIVRLRIKATEFSLVLGIGLLLCSVILLCHLIQKSLKPVILYQKRSLNSVNLNV
jgi:hypothetical protein